MNNFCVLTIGNPYLPNMGQTVFIEQMKGVKWEKEWMYEGRASVTFLRQSRLVTGSGCLRAMGLLWANPGQYRVSARRSRFLFPGGLVGFT